MLWWRLSQKAAGAPAILIITGMQTYWDHSAFPLPTLPLSTKNNFAWALHIVKGHRKENSATDLLKISSSRIHRLWLGRYSQLRLHGLAGRYDNLKLELTLSPSHGSLNSASGTTPQTLSYPSPMLGLSASKGKSRYRLHYVLSYTTKSTMFTLR
jgi:hypothetical protein